MKGRDLRRIAGWSLLVPWWPLVYALVRQWRGQVVNWTEIALLVSATVLWLAAVWIVVGLWLLLESLLKRKSDGLGHIDVKDSGRATLKGSGMRAGYLVAVTIVLVVAILVVGGLRAYEMQLAEHRYSIVSVGPVRAYKLDRKTGKTWFIVGGVEAPCSQRPYP